MLPSLSNRNGAYVRLQNQIHDPIHKSYLLLRRTTRWVKCPPNVCKYLGITLLPQAGVALGMCITARQLGAQGDLIRNIILFSVLIYELVGPMLTKMALTRAGDIQPMSDEIKNRRQRKLEESLANRDNQV